MTRSDSILPGKISVTRRKDFSRLWAAQREFCSRFLRGRFPFRLIVHSDRPLDRSLAGTGNQLTLGWRIHRAFGDVCDPTLARRHQNPTSAPPCEPPTAQKPCRGYPVIVGQEARLADIKKRCLRHPMNLPRHRNRAGATRSSLVKKRHSQTSKSAVCATRTQENHDPHPNASGDYACLPRWIMI